MQEAKNKKQRNFSLRNNSFSSNHSLVMVIISSTSLGSYVELWSLSVQVCLAAPFSRKKQGRSKSKSKSRKAERERKSKLSLLDAESLARWWSSFLFVLVLSFVSSFIIGRHRCPEVAIVIDPFKPIRSLGGRSCIVHRPSRLPCDSSTCIRHRLRRL